MNPLTYVVINGKNKNHSHRSNEYLREIKTKTKYGHKKRRRNSVVQVAVAGDTESKGKKGLSKNAQNNNCDYSIAMHKSQHMGPIHANRHP